MHLSESQNIVISSFSYNLCMKTITFPFRGSILYSGFYIGSYACVFSACRCKLFKFFNLFGKHFFQLHTSFIAFIITPRKFIRAMAGKGARIGFHSQHPLYHIFATINYNSITRFMSTMLLHKLIAVHHRGGVA